MLSVIWGLLVLVGIERGRQIGRGFLVPVVAGRHVGVIVVSGAWINNPCCFTDHTRASATLGCTQTSVTLQCMFHFFQTLGIWLLKCPRRKLLRVTSVKNHSLSNKDANYSSWTRTDQLHRTRKLPLCSHQQRNTTAASLPSISERCGIFLETFHEFLRLFIDEFLAFRYLSKGGSLCREIKRNKKKEKNMIHGYVANFILK